MNQQRMLSLISFVVYNFYSNLNTLPSTCLVRSEISYVFSYFYFFKFLLMYTLDETYCYVCIGIGSIFHIFWEFYISKNSFTNNTFKFRLCWMNQQCMLSLISFVFIICITIMTLGYLPQVQVRFHVSSQIWSFRILFFPRLLSQISHLNLDYVEWTNNKCSLYSLLS